MSPRRTHTRPVAILAAASALAVASLAPSASAQTTPSGIGSSVGAVSLLTATVGADALSLRLLGEDSQTSNDPGAGGPSALERVSPIQVASSLLPALAGVSQPSVQTSTTSGEDARSTDAVDLGALLASGPVPGLLTGTIDPIALRSAVDANGAVSTAAGAVRNIALLGGLLSTGTASADLGSTALIGDARSSRGLQLDRLEVLDLTALLDSLGISLADLPIDVLVGLLDQLGLALPGGLTADALLATIDGLLDQTAAVRAQVTVLQGQVDGLQVQLAPLTSQLTTATALVSSLTGQLAAQQALLDACIVPVLCAPIQALVTSLSGQLATATASVASIDAAIDALQAQIEGLLDQIDALLATIQGALDDLLGLLDGLVGSLDGAPLLSVDDLAASVSAVADDTLATSSAAVVASIGDVRLGALSLGGLDAGAAGAALSGLADQVTSALGAVLATIDPSLAGLVDIDLLDQTTSVTQDAAGTAASAAVTALRATVTPPDVCALLGRLGAVTDTLGSVLTGLDAALPAVPGPVGDVLDQLGSTVTCTGGVAAALTQPLTVEALRVAGSAAFAVPAAPGAPGAPGTPGAPELPVTGGNGTLALLAVGVGVLGLATRRVLARC